MHRLANIDRRVIYLVVAVMVFLPMYRPIGLPMSVSNQVQNAYDTIDALPEGAVVLVSPSYTPAADAETWPQTLAICRHLMEKNVRMLWVNLMPESIMYAERAIDELAEEFGYRDGEDYVVLPFTAGLQTAVASLGRGLRETFSVDVHGRRLNDLPMMDDVQDITDIELIVDFNTGDTSIFYLQQIVNRYNVPLVTGASGVTVPYLMPYLGTGQLSGLLGGMRGAAEYELLIDAPGSALAGMDAQSLAHLSIILFIALGNVSYLMTRKKTEEGV